MIPETLQDRTIKAMLRDAEHRYPREACGLIVIDPIDKSEHYIPCNNLSKDPTEEFVLDPASYAEAEELGEIVGVCHSHPDGTSRPSVHDMAVMNRNRELQVEVDPDAPAIPWHIVSWPEGDYRQIIPEVHKGLLGRPFVHNVWDCWATCEAYYKKYPGLSFRSFHREDLWWEKQDTTSFYEEFYEECGFERVTEVQPGDMVVMQIGRTYHPNHAGIYLGKIDQFEEQGLHGGPFMLHHMWGKPSEIIVYGGQWEQRTRMILRHKELV